ncbi:MAG: cytochrome-c oxidase, cbb3-type subunit III [Alphaproteobacteria bacterium]|nr:MAG: cytochrome-c oxidase, cbb3-type subunit III [Alphaproteobacteria bacterium]
MSVEERDPVSGERLTGHDWNGIKELDTPVPRGILIFVIITHIIAVVYWFLTPAWPFGESYTRGLLGIDQRKTVEEQIVASTTQRAAWSKQIETADFATIQADANLMSIVRSTGHQLFGDNCAACHGIDGKGRANYPNLTDDDWQWGGDVQRIAETISVGVNTANPGTRLAEMPRFGVDQMLPGEDIEKAASYIYSLSNPDHATTGTAERIAAGREVFVANCATCHGDDARGKSDVGAPNLTDKRWLYGGEMETIIATIHGGRRGHMPTWDQRLTLTEIKILALYVHSLGAGDS